MGIPDVADQLRRLRNLAVVVKRLVGPVVGGFLFAIGVGMHLRPAVLHYLFGLPSSVVVPGATGWLVAGAIVILGSVVFWLHNEVKVRRALEDELRAEAAEQLAAVKAKTDELVAACDKLEKAGLEYAQKLERAEQQLAAKKKQ